MVAALLAWVLLLIPLAFPAAAQERVLNVYNWTDYIDPAALERFQKETGITVHYDVFDSLETLEAKLLAGHSGYDVVVPSNEPTFSRLIKVGALAPIDRARVPNWKNLDPGLMHRGRELRSGQPLWGDLSVGHHRARHDPRPREAARARRADGQLGPAVQAGERQTHRTVRHHHDGFGDRRDSRRAEIPGQDPDSTDAADLAAVEHTLMGIRRYIRSFASGGALEALASGQTCLALDYSGDVIQAGARAAEAKRGVTVRYVAPKEGAQLGFDMLAIPADAEHKDAALAFIDFVLRPEVMAGITNTVRYANAVPASRPMIRPELLADTNIFPTPEQMATFFTIGPVPQAAARERTRMWARFKAGR